MRLRAKLLCCLSNLFHFLTPSRTQHLHIEKAAKKISIERENPPHTHTRWLIFDLRNQPLGALLSLLMLMLMLILLLFKPVLNKLLDMYFVCVHIVAEKQPQPYQNFQMNECSEITAFTWSPNFSIFYRLLFFHTEFPYFYALWFSGFFACTTYKSGENRCHQCPSVWVPILTIQPHFPSVLIVYNKSRNGIWITLNLCLR